MNADIRTLPARLPGVSIFFDESGTFRFGLQIDLSRFSFKQSDAEALYQRFYTRIMSEYDRLSLHIAAVSDESDVCHPKPGDEPISAYMLTDDVFFFQIMPVDLKRDVLSDILPTKLREFVTFMIGAEEGDE